MTLILAPQPRPKLLTVVTVPTGGWDLQFKTSTSSSLDTTNTITIPAGDYFVSGDRQADDFVDEIQRLMEADLSLSGEIPVWIDSNNKVRFSFDGSTFQGTGQDVSIDWTAADGDEIGKVLGFDTSADDQATGADNPTITGDYQHGYAWYADADGYIESDLPQDSDSATVLQSLTPRGQSIAQFIASQQRNFMSMQYIPETRMWSGDKGYGDASIYPYARNVPLECWWQEARQGKRFRVYRDGQIDSSRFVNSGTMTSGTDETTLEDTTKSWNTDPDRWVGRLAYVESWGNNISNVRVWGYISANTATTLTLPEIGNPPAGSGSEWDRATTQYYLLENTYRTYVLDLGQMSEFRPNEYPNINEYSITIPLIRYQS